LLGCLRKTGRLRANSSRRLTRSQPLERKRRSLNSKGPFSWRSGSAGRPTLKFHPEAGLALRCRQPLTGTRGTEHAVPCQIRNRGLIITLINLEVGSSDRLNFMNPFYPGILGAWIGGVGGERRNLKLGIKAGRRMKSVVQFVSEKVWRASPACSRSCGAHRRRWLQKGAALGGQRTRQTAPIRSGAARATGQKGSSNPFESRPN